MNQNRKKKTNKIKNKQRKRKTRLTREYRENEIEVQRLLEKTSLSIERNSPTQDVHDKDVQSQSTDFFCRISELGDISNTQRARDSKKTAKLEEAQSTDENTNTEDEENSNVEPSEHSSSVTHGNQTTASTYIQIELDPVTQMRCASEKLKLNPQLLYVPKREICPSLKIQTEQEAQMLSAQTCRVINRYSQENDGGGTTSQFEEIFKTLQQDDAKRYTKYCKDKALYRTYCEHEFHPIFCEPTRDAVEIPTRKFIKIFLKELRFTQHPQLEEEHRLANRLEDAYHSYVGSMREKTSEKLHAALQTERRIVSDLLKRETQESTESKSAEEETKRTKILEQHLFAVKMQRNALYQAETEQKQLLQELLDLWKQLKVIRKQQGYQRTRLKLRLIVTHVADVAAERRTWMQRFEADLNEIYREELETYYIGKRLWKKRDRTVDSVSMPKKPDIEQLSEELKLKLAECTRLPGEPKVEIFYKRTSDDEFYDMPSALIQRRQLKSFFLKLYFDGQYVGMTRSYRLEPDLSLAINEAIGIFLERRLPKDIKITLYEKSKLPKLPLKIANIIVPLPLGSDLSAFERQSVIFSSHKQPISGKLSLRFDCDESIYPTEMIKVLFPPPEERLKPQSTTKDPPAPASRYSNQENDIATETDDNDSDMEGKKLNRMAKEQTCTFEENLLMFCSMDELENNQRFKILRSRFQQNDTRTKDLRYIPSLEHELEYAYDEQEDVVIDAGNWMDPIDLHKHEGKKYLKLLYDAICNQCTRLSKVMENSENLLLGDEPATLSSFLQAISNMFSPRRPLNPPRNDALMLPQMPNDSPHNMQNVNIILNVVRATGIPVRRSRPNLETDSRQRSSGSSSVFIPQQNFKYSNVRPFVALSYKDKLIRTMTAEGSNPTWNEQLILQLNGNLENLRDDVKILLFDEVIENHINDDITVRNMDVYQRIQTNWLGEYRMPISTMFMRKKIEGVFEFSTPKVLIGYQRPTLDNITTNSETNILVENMPEIKEAVHLWFYISIESGFEVPHVNTKCLECSELREVRLHLQEWCIIAKEMQPLRFIDPLVCTIDGKRVCLTRLLEAIPLPIEASENLLDSACRFVSLLSVIKGYDASMGFNGVWLNNQTILDTTWGAAKDFGILLANFLISIGIPCWVVLCNGHPYGPSVFVLYRSNEHDEFILADPCTGCRYLVNDGFCPIKNVDYIIGQDNIYCNIQSETRIAMMNFNVHDSACWLPAFSKKNPAPIGGVQNLSYIFKNSFSTLELRKNIERKVMKKISTWRAMRKTIWNRAFQTRLQDILLELENSSTFISSSSSNVEFKYADQLAAEFPSYEIYGFTLNFAYTNLSSISERIKSTGIHLNSSKTVEFCLAVHIHAYTNNVLSIWIFLLSLIPL